MKNKHLETLSNICHSNLKNSKKSIEYLRSDRGLSSDIIKLYKIGYFPQNLEKLYSYIPEEELIRLNISRNRASSQFSDYFSLIFPILSEYGEVVGISGRTMVDEEQRKFINIPKYKNSSYKKSNYLFGLDKSKNHIIQKNEAYVVEGYFDQISMFQSGIKNCVAICGTAFSKNHFLKLSRYCDKIIFILDNDSAGIRSSERIYNKYINKGVKIRLKNLPNKYKDIDEYFSDYNNSKETFFRDSINYVPNF